ncbi:hypothetical protein BIW11_01399 [Tropilaelaps mercedesae]|uniref:Uncharacterized protein n=1 Tax=Tropilaelaps mercedesae TaxID=418985 RepID=A0A1V9XEV4_9ACAR|nr:hypothetical protein BIW11_01399 [Tropilaelaps mercedesae]
MESTLCVDDELKEDEYDALNDETFGGAEADDAWEENHNVLAAQLEETIKREHNAQHIEDIVNTSILQLGLDDEAATNGHSLPTGPATIGSDTPSDTSLRGVGAVNRNALVGSTQQATNACPPGFNGFYSRPAVLGGGAALAGMPTGQSHATPMGRPPVPAGVQLGQSNRPGAVVARPPAAVQPQSSPFGSGRGAGFPPMISCSAVSAEQLEQQMLQASRTPPMRDQRVKLHEEPEKKMVQEARMVLLGRQNQQKQQQQQHPHQTQQQPSLTLGPQQQQHQADQRPPTAQYRIMRPQHQQLPPQQPPFPPASLQMMPPPPPHPHAPTPGVIALGHHQRPPHSTQPPHQNVPVDLDCKKVTQATQLPQPHHHLPQVQHQQQQQHHQLQASHVDQQQHRTYRFPDHYGYPDPRPPPWEANHNLHHSRWSPQPAYPPPPPHFHRPPFHQSAGPSKFMSFREPYRGNGRRHDDVRLPDWNSTGGQRRYNTRDVETFGFDAVHEHQQEQDASKAASNPRSDDPYAGLMTDKEKEFVIRVQMMSLNMQAPYEQDYYYLENMKRRSQGKGVCGDKLLKQRYERTPGRPHEPQQFENSLGKLHTVTAYAPKKILDMAGSRMLDDGDGRTVPANTSLLLFRKLLMDTERSFSLLLKLEDPEVLTPREEKLVAAQDLVKRLGASPVNVLSLRKGRMLVLRSLAALWRLGGHREQCLQMLCSIIENLDLILVKQKQLSDSVFVEKFDIIEDILRECIPDEIARLQKCMSKYNTPGDEIGEWVLRGKFGSMLNEKLAECSAAAR